MRSCLVLAALGMVACGDSISTDDVAPTTDSGTAGTTPDPRFDPSTWPSTVTSASRDVPVFAPTTYAGEGLLPVLLSLHGYGGNGALQDGYWGTSDYVDDGNFLLAIPDGTTDRTGAQFWNATDLCCNFGDSDVDDVAFLLGVLDELEAHFPVDPERIYVAGHSNGGFMSYRLACEAADRITAIGSLAGSGFSDPADCTPTEPVSILQVHGTNDTVIPYADGWTPGARVMMERWADRNGCGKPTKGAALDLVPGIPDAETRTEQWSACDDGALVELWTIDDASHVPGFDDAWIDNLWSWLSAQR